MRYMPNVLIRLCLVLAISVGLIGVGFGHPAAAPSDPDLIAFLQAGGTPDDLCATGTPAQHWGQTECEACRLSDTTYAPTASNAALTVGEICAATLNATTYAAPCATPRGGAHPARAPPVLVMI